ncbi:MAG: DUF4340 domain-containing protein [Candidatus Xenobia bacterium]
MNVKSTLLLGVLFIGLLLIFLNADKLQPKGPDTNGNAKVFAFSNDDVEGLSITHAAPTPSPAASSSPSAAASSSASPAASPAASPTNVSFSKQNGQWIEDAPLKTLASANDVSGIVSDLTALTIDKDEQINSKDLTAYGLDHPEYTLDIKAKGGDKKLLIGKSVIGGNGGNYAKLADSDQIFVASQGIYTAISKTPDQFREKAPLAVEPEKVSKFSFTRDNQTVTAERDKDDHEKWNVTSPITGKADTAEVMNALWGIKNIQVRDFRSDVKPDDPRLKATITVQVWTDPKGQPATLTIGSEDPKTKEWFATRSPLNEVVMIGDNNISPLKKTAFDLMDRHLVSFEPMDVGTVTITSPGGEVEAKKDGVKYDVQKPAGKKDDLNKLPAAVSTLSNLKWDDRPDKPKADKAYGFDKPQATIAITKDDGSSVGKVIFGSVAAKPNTVWAKVDGKPEVYEVPADAVTSLTSLVSTFTGVPVAAPKATPKAASSASPTAASASPPASSASPAAAASATPSTAARPSAIPSTVLAKPSVTPASAASPHH